MINPISDPLDAMVAMRNLRMRIEKGEEFETMTGNALKWTRAAVEEAEKIKALLPTGIEEYNIAAKGGR